MNLHDILFAGAGRGSLYDQLLYRKMVSSGEIITTEYAPIASFVTNKAQKALAVSVMLEPIQEGSGTPSPDNVRPISGRTEVVTHRTGKNLCDVSATTHSAYNIGSIPNTLLPNTQYTFSVNGTTTRKYRLYLAPTSTPLNAQIALNAGYIGEGESQTFTTPSNLAGYLLCLAGSNNGAGNEDLSLILPQIELGSTATAYEPYQGTTYTTALGRTVYGGTLDVVSGELVVDRAMVDLGSLDWTMSTSGQFNRFYSNGLKTIIKAPTSPSAIPQNVISSQYETVSFNTVYTATTDGVLAITATDSQAYGNVNVVDSRYASASEFKTAMSGVQLCYELATPQTYQLTPTEVALLLGNNNVWSDGDVSVTYKR